MSTPKIPYYYEENSDVYHWERDCSDNHYPLGGWIQTDEKPLGKEKCAQCEAK